MTKLYNHTGWQGLLLLSISLCTNLAHGVTAMTPADILGWERRDFAAPTEYRLGQYAGMTALQASCSNAASALYLEQSIDLRKTPVLEWSWAIEKVFTGTDETQKSGDDYPVRLYVVKDGGLLPWRTRAVNYVWSSNQAIGEVWNNAYAGQAKMLALRSGAPEQADQQFVTERRNVRKDFASLHGVELDTIDGLAIMTDCDDSGQPVTGWYGDVNWLPESD